MMNKRLLNRLPALSALVLAAGFAGSAVAQLTVVSFGGSYQDAQSKALFQPAAKAIGATAKEETYTSITAVALQVKAGAVTWDVVTSGSGGAARSGAEGMLEALDYKVIDVSNFVPGSAQPYYVCGDVFSTVMAWNTKTYGDKGPQSWADFWDIKKFPGKRSMHGKVNYNLEAALMADGVPAANVYKLLATKEGQERAWKKLAEIAPHVTVWYRGGSQSAQLLRDGEVDMIHMGHNRVESVKASGKPVAYTFDGGTMDIDCLLVPKGAPNKANAMKLINEMLEARAQATLAKAMPLGPVNVKAFDSGVLTPQEMLNVNTHASNYGKQLLVDPNFYIGQLDRLTERFDTLIQKR